MKRLDSRLRGNDKFDHLQRSSKSYGGETGKGGREYRLDSRQVHCGNDKGGVLEGVIEAIMAEEFIPEHIDIHDEEMEQGKAGGNGE